MLYNILIVASVVLVISLVSCTIGYLIGKKLASLKNNPELPSNRYWESRKAERETVLFFPDSDTPQVKVEKAGEKAYKKDTVLFFPDSKGTCSDYLNNRCTRIQCHYAHDGTNYFKLYRALEVASIIKVCVFDFKEQNLGKLLAKLHNHKRAVIKIICNADHANKTDSQIQKLLEVGIEIRKRGTEKGWMHNKYAILNDRQVLYGSANWTYSAFTENNEFIVITQQPNKVRAFMSNFEELWARLAK